MNKTNVTMWIVAAFLFGFIVGCIHGAGFSRPPVDNNYCTQDTDIRCGHE